MISALVSVFLTLAKSLLILVPFVEGRPFGQFSVISIFGCLFIQARIMWKLLFLVFKTEKQTETDREGEERNVKQRREDEKQLQLICKVENEEKWRGVLEV